MKNKNIIIAMGVIIVALIGVVVYLLVKENNDEIVERLVKSL